MKFLESAYSFKYEGVDTHGKHIYRFDSVGENTVTKIISIVLLDGVKHFGGDCYNIGFRNKNSTDINNSGDFDAVIATAFVCAIKFLENNPKATVLFFGDADHKQTLYRRKMFSHADTLSDLLLVGGGYLTQKVPTIPVIEKRMRKGKEVEVTTNKKDIDAIIDTVDIKKIEKYNKKNSKDYAFIFIRLN